MKAFSFVYMYPVPQKPPVSNHGRVRYAKNVKWK